MCGPHGKTQLAVLWTRGDRASAEALVFKYVKDAAANGWWSQISMLIMGPAVTLVANDVSLLDKIRELTANGVEVKANLDEIQTADAAEKLRDIGVNGKELAEGLTEILQDKYEEWAILTV